MRGLFSSFRESGAKPTTAWHIMEVLNVCHGIAVFNHMSLDGYMGTLNFQAGSEVER